MKVKYKDKIDSFEELIKEIKNADILKINRKNLLFYRQGDDRIYAYWKESRLTNPFHGFSARIEVGNVLKREYSSWMSIGNTTDFQVLQCRPAAAARPSERRFNRIKPELKAVINDLEKYKDEINLGVELELERDKRTVSSRLSSVLIKTVGSLFNSVGYDCSVFNGTEIRFNHPALAGWSVNKVRAMMSLLVDKGFNHKRQTAGMHIHMSAPCKEDTRRAAVRFLEFADDMREILYPISARQDIKHTRSTFGRYGLGNNITRGYTCHGTLEVRVWEATTNPEIFMARLKFADYLMRFLLSSAPISAFFDNMSKEDKLNYKLMLDDPENPHAFGIGHTAALKKLNLEA